jgi:putative heme-binding domain-containing protein
MIQLANTEGFIHKNVANWWINNRKGNLWKAHNINETLKAMGQDPDNTKLFAVELPTEPANAPKLPSTEEILKLQGDAARGKIAIAACYMCHRIGDQGIDYGPDLTTFGKQQSTEVIINSILHPSDNITHGYESFEVKTTDGITITGVLLSRGDPVMIKCIGDQTQTIPKSRVASMQYLERSLMYSPSQLGLSAQAIADITAYLKNR